MIGHDLGGRYEIISRIGGGGMALVYKAHDVLLNRYVAVKVLRQQFVHDEEFIHRFRREAQSAAALSHPNVVSIYDVGQEDDTHYIVMEYIEGHNLNEIIQERAPLQAEEAVRIAVQIADALDHAHSNHIIHRDIKPHNILIGKNGRVKVTDFGIARAVTSSTITQTGSVVGSVHYFSPEHAKGVTAGEKSDIYSLGIVLYQMVTGRLPFLGESPISVALKHLQEPFEEPRKVNPHIPQSVENIILRAMRKNPSERYVSAREMLSDLDNCLRPERLNEPKADFESDHDLEETRVMPAIRPGDFKPAASIADKPPERHPAHANPAHSASPVLERKQASADTASPKAKGWKRPTTIVISTLVILALIICGFIWLLGKLDTPEVDVPNVIGQTEEAARQMIEEKGLKVEEPVQHEYNDEIAKGIVFDQNKQHMTTKQGSSIALKVSDGPQPELLSDYRGQQIKSVKDALIALGVDANSIQVTEQYSDDQDPGVVLEQTPAPQSEFVPEEATFTFVVSKGKETFNMPKLVGKSLADAKKMIADAGLKLSDDDILYESSYEYAKDQVIDQSPYAAGEAVSKGASISLRVSSGAPADAKQYQFNVDISPAQEGKKSEVLLIYSDARGQNVEEKHTITKRQVFPVTVILSPNTEATLMVMRDDQFIDTVSISYDDIVNGETSSVVAVPADNKPADSQPSPDQSPDNPASPDNGSGTDAGHNGNNGNGDGKNHGGNEGNN
ncbi:Stk1 family PASTA domain-containing Ser/Thr kinase [Paenibacillus protaetiae]|uniref:Serine/threonine-protein kinase PrkC n=1 Tax=Paenibacillus protaetiae TaxID=2509456 RepID=A0A4P6ER80_9BACL|nr:Stk1 family PASTA domain-containing Ser/Thr kinase [Paenibacillus protaetiae]QAY65530.1 Stk1 family PASTA domain-containing Ser/Thr kinase [Paenibacillus protaetiae]